MSLKMPLTAANNKYLKKFIMVYIIKHDLPKYNYIMAKKGTVFAFQKV